MSSRSAEAFALLRAGRAQEAERLLRVAVADAPQDAEAAHLLGFVLAGSGRAAEGLPLLDRSLVLSPGNVGFLDNRAQILLQMGLLDEALADARAVTSSEPRFAEGWLHLAQVLRRLGQVRESLGAANRVLAIDPSHVPATYHLAVLALESGELAAAEAGFARVVAVQPDHAAAHNNLGVVYRETGRDEAALRVFARAAALDPASAQAQNNLGLALRQLGRLEEAHAALTRAGYPESLANAAGIAMELERPDEARDLYARAAAARPGFADAEYGLGQVALREGRFGPGWEGYERRFETRPPLAATREFAIPRLQAGDLERARRVAVWAEQGLGDVVLFTTLLPELARRGIAAIVEVDARLLGLYRRSLPEFEFVPRGSPAAAFERCDFHLPMGSLARLFRHDVASFAGQPRAMLAADPARVAAMREALGAARTVAISWRSPQAGGRRALGERKSIPLDVFAARASGEGARLLDLQYGDVDEERRRFEAAHPGGLLRLPGLDLREDLEGVAAALVACGRLVTVSNATAHLAGALGVETVVLLPRGWAPFFYWAGAREGHSLWYPSVSIASAS